MPPTPLAGPPPAEVPLATPPLVRVIAQVRFPLVASIERQEFIGPFQESIRKDYPVLRPEQSRNVVVGSEGTMEARATTTWRFLDLSSDWRVTLAPDFLALETSRYTNHSEFLSRFQQILEALKAHIDPKVIDRLGVRYIDRIEEPHLSDLPALIRPEVSGILATPLFEHVRHALTENVFVLPEGQGLVTARWGWVPSRGTVDPAAIEPIEIPSWLLDLDAFQSFQASERPLDVGAIIAQAQGFADRIYSIFRWVVTDEFLRRYGGKP